MNAYECVAMQTLIEGDMCLTISHWAPGGSDWRPAFLRKPGELHIYVTTTGTDA